MRLRSAIQALITIFVLLPSSLRGQEDRPTQTYELPMQPLNLMPVPDIPGDSETRKAIDVAIRQKDFINAEDQLIKLIEHNPNSPVLLVLLGRVLFMDGKYLNAAVAFKKAERLLPSKRRTISPWPCPLLFSTARTGQIRGCFQKLRKSKPIEPSAGRKIGPPRPIILGYSCLIGGIFPRQNRI